MSERISLADGTFYRAYGNHIQRYEFASTYCAGANVLDAGCGIGYGSAFLASLPGTRVVGLDIADDAVAEAVRLFQKPNLRFRKADVETIGADPELRRGGPYGAVVNFENIEHLDHPERMLEGAASLLDPAGVFLTSTPNGAISERDASGRYVTSPFHVHEFTEDEFRALLGRSFSRIEFFGQWRTPAGVYRQQWDTMLFNQVTESYYNPTARLYRGLKRLLGKPTLPPPEYLSAASAVPGDFSIAPLDAPPFPWPPEVLLAVCRA